MVICTICKRIFSTQFNLNKHRKNVHKVQALVISYDKEVWGHKCLETTCNNSFRTNSNLIQHLKEMHNVNISVDDLEFDNMRAFIDWKSEVEANGKVNYVLARGKRKKTEKVSVYICNRSGKPVCKKSKRATKSQGSCKIYTSCISEIRAFEKDNKIKVTYVKSHYGHQIQVEHIRLSRNIRDMVATKLIMGASQNRILDDVRKQIGDEGDIKRMDLLTKQDINNIKRSYKLEIHEEIQDGVRHINDSISIDLWVAECQKLESNQNPVLLYKKQGIPMKNFVDDDFYLVIMNDFQQKMLKKFGNNIIAVDSTHGLNNYNFELTTIMIVEDTYEGFPVAFMFTNRKDTMASTIFFETIKSRVGLVKCKTFMTDLTGTFYNAWASVMGSVPHQLYCSWYVDRAWKNNLGKIADKDKSKLVYKTLKFLQTTLDESHFIDELNAAVKHMLEDKDTENFGKYFETYYSNNYHLWAYCFRKKCGINTNMFLESMHKVVKYFYLGRTKVKRLDKGLHAVLNYTRDKMVDRLIKNTKGKQSNAKKDIVKCHRVSVTSSFIVKPDENMWLLQSGESQYMVKKELLSINKCCNLFCDVCNICIHAYTCTCPNSYIRSTICKHVHYICLNFFEDLQKSDTELDYNINDIEIEKESIITTLNKNFDNKNKLKEKIISKMASLQTKVFNANFDEVQEDALEQIMNHLSNAEHLFNFKVNLDASNFKETCEGVSANQKIQKQQSFYSTKKKNKVVKTLAKPNNLEIKNIKRFLGGDTKTIIGENNDHSYYDCNDGK